MPQKARKTITEAEVLENSGAGSFYHLKLRTDESAFFDLRPGRFIELDASQLALPTAEKIPEDVLDKSDRKVTLRRPFSFCNAETAGSKTVLELIYCVLGPATVRMISLRPGDTVSIIGPLGNGFDVPDNIENAVLVAGGMGAPPLQHLASLLSEKYPRIRTKAFVGAASKTRLPWFDVRFEGERVNIRAFSKYDIETVVCTDDGSAGFKGFVTEQLEKTLSEGDLSPERTMIYACGPEGMLAETARIAGKHEMPCRVSMERMMACGIGLCQSCAVKVKSAEPPGWRYKLCCKDGPVFDADEVIFE